MNWLALRNWSEAERSAMAALAQDPGDEQAAADLVEAYRRQGRFAEALEVCAKALEREPRPQLLLNRALVLSDLQQAEAAVAALDSTLELVLGGTEDALSAFIASRAFALAGRDELALGAAQRAVVLNPSEPRFLSHLGALLMTVDPPLAERRLRQSLVLDARQPEALNNLGAVFLGQHRLEGAAAAFRAAIGLAPSYTLARTNLATVMLQKGRASPVLPVLLLPVSCSLWLTWTSFSLGPSGFDVSWPRLAGSMVLLGFAIVLATLSKRLAAARLARRDPGLAALMRTVEADMNEGRIGYRELIPVVRVTGHALRGFGVLVLLGALVGEVLVLRHFIQHRVSSDFLGMALLLLGAAVGGLCVYEGRALLAQAARQAADRG